VAPLVGNGEGTGLAPEETVGGEAPEGVVARHQVALDCQYRQQYLRGEAGGDVVDGSAAAMASSVDLPMAIWVALKSPLAAAAAAFKRWSRVVAATK